MTTPKPELPLQGVKVVELGVWIAGPAAGAIMADWGADVIKVEPPAGDPQRLGFRALGMDEGRMAPFELDNRGKKSIVLDLRDPECLDTMFRLLEDADIFLTNVRMDGLRRIGIDPDTVRSRFPKLIYGLLTGYGASGPDAHRAGYDSGGFWSRSGMALQMVPEGAPPTSLPPSLGDHITGIAMVSGLMAALFQRVHSGQGAMVDASLLRTGIYALGADLTMQQNFGKSIPKQGRHEASVPMVNCYQAKDGKWIWLLGVEAARHWPKLVEAMGRPDLAEDPRFIGTRNQVRNRRELIEEIDQEIAKHDSKYWQARFDEVDLWWAPVNTLQDVLDDPQAIASGAFVEIPGFGELGPIPSVASPISFEGSSMPPRGPSPALGQHTDEILKKLSNA